MDIYLAYNKLKRRKDKLAAEVAVKRLGLLTAAREKVRQSRKVNILWNTINLSVSS